MSTAVTDAPEHKPATSPPRRGGRGIALMAALLAAAIALAASGVLLTRMAAPQADVGPEEREVPRSSSTANAPAAVVTERSGEGRSTPQMVEHPGGVAIIKYQHSGDGAFSLRVLGRDGEPELAGGAGPQAGSRAVQLAAGTYPISVRADGAWSYGWTAVGRVEQPLPAAHQSSGSEAIPFRTEGGPIVLDIRHAGPGPFEMRLLRLDRPAPVRLVHTAVATGGSTSGQTDLGLLAAGSYVLDVRADGAWAMEQIRSDGHADGDQEP
jgi:hypothetical protein